MTDLKIDNALARGAWREEYHGFVDKPTSAKVRRMWGTVTPSHGFPGLRGILSGHPIFSATAKAEHAALSTVDQIPERQS